MFAQIAAGLLAILWFDFGPSLPFDDDWGMSWGARQLIQHHTFRVFPEQSALALTQNLWSALVTFGHTDPIALRLSNYAMVPATVVLIYAISRRLGASQFWSAIAGATLLAAPVYSNLAASYMTEPTYIALMGGAAYCGIRWLDGTGWRLGLITLVVLATLQRQIGAVIPVALIVAIFASRQGIESRREYVWLIAAFAAAAIALAVPILSHVAPPTQANRLSGLAHLQVSQQLYPLLAVSLQLAFYLAPWSLPIVLTKRTGRSLHLFGVGSIGLALLGLYTVSRHGPYLFPPSTFHQTGFLTFLHGLKPELFPFWSVAIIVGLILLGVEAIFIWRADYWRPSAIGFGQTLLVALSVVHFLPTLLLQTQVFDRYYLVAAVGLIPVVAALVSKADLSPKREAVAGLFAIFAIIAGLAVFVVGQQDYEAWQKARDDAARMAYQLAPPNRVDAGYEANAQYVEVPQYDKTGSVEGGLARGLGDYGFPIYGPVNPLIRLEYAPLSDPRSGVTYRSLASGKIILDMSPRPPGIPRFSGN